MAHCRRALSYQIPFARRLVQEPLLRCTAPSAICPADAFLVPGGRILLCEFHPAPRRSEAMQRLYLLWSPCKRRYPHIIHALLPHRREPPAHSGIPLSGGRTHFLPITTPQCVGIAVKCHSPAKIHPALPLLRTAGHRHNSPIARWRNLHCHGRRR